MMNVTTIFDIRDGVNEYTETWEMVGSNTFDKLLPDSDPDNLTDMDEKFLLNEFFAFGLRWGEDDEGNESLEATKEECKGYYWLGCGERMARVSSVDTSQYTEHEKTQRVSKLKEIIDDVVKYHVDPLDDVDDDDNEYFTEDGEPTEEAKNTYNMVWIPRDILEKAQEAMKGITHEAK